MTPAPQPERTTTKRADCIEHGCNCSTCTDKSCWYSVIYDTKINRSPKDVAKWKEYLTVKNFTAQYGCASHSSRPAPSPQNPCKDIGYCDVCENINCKHSKVSITAIRNATLDELVAYHKDMIVRLHTPKNGAVSIVSVRSAVISHEKSIAKIESLRKEQP